MNASSPNLPSFHFCNFVIKRAGRGEGSQKTEQTKSNEEHGIEGDQSLEGKFRQSLRFLKNVLESLKKSLILLKSQAHHPALAATTTSLYECRLEESVKSLPGVLLAPNQVLDPSGKEEHPMQKQGKSEGRLATWRATWWATWWASLRAGGQPGSDAIRKMFPLLQKKVPPQTSNLQPLR